MKANAETTALLTDVVHAKATELAAARETIRNQELRIAELERQVKDLKKDLKKALR